MPIPKVIGRWNKAGLNRLTRHIAPWTPGFGVIVHRGRRSGRHYQTPVNVFRSGNGSVIALTYGPQTDWVKNVLAAGGCELRTRGQTVQLGSPHLFHDQSRSSIRPSSGRYCGSLTSPTSCLSHPRRSARLHPASSQLDHARKIKNEPTTEGKRPIHRSRHATPPRCAGASLAGCWWLALQNRMFGVLVLAPEPASGADDGTVA